jgi:very-short-patch-repair endonuclease
MGNKLATAAARQHGILTSSQLQALGLSRKQVHTEVRKGHLHRIHTTIYAVGHPRLTPLARFMAATLATGGALSHLSAAHLWKIKEGLLSPVHVTVPSASGRAARGGIVVHRSRNPVETTTRFGIPVTTPARVLLDLAGTLDARGHQRAMEEAHYLELVTPAQLDAIAAAHPNAKGRNRLTFTPGTTRTRSEVEERFLAFCHRHDLPQPILNATVDGAVRDAYFPDADLVVEIDPWHTHRLRAREDKARDRTLVANGRAAFRLTDEDFDAQAADELRRALARRAGVSSSIDEKNPPTVSIRSSSDSAR